MSKLGDHKPWIALTWVKKFVFVMSLLLHCDVIKTPSVQTWFVYFFLSVQPLSTNFGFYSLWGQQPWSLRSWLTAFWHSYSLLNNLRHSSFSWSPSSSSFSVGDVPAEIKARFKTGGFSRATSVSDLQDRLHKKLEELRGSDHEIFFFNVIIW